MDLRPYRDRGAKLSDYLPWAALVAPGVVPKTSSGKVRRREAKKRLELGELELLTDADSRVDSMPPSRMEGALMSTPPGEMMVGSARSSSMSEAQQVGGE